jgi:hypothetical protein
MDDKTRSRYEAKAAELKADLKQWEGDWASSHDGSKPGREDIKSNPDIGTMTILASRDSGENKAEKKQQRSTRTTTRFGIFSRARSRYRRRAHRSRRSGNPTMHQSRRP